MNFYIQDLLGKHNWFIVSRIEFIKLGNLILQNSKDLHPIVLIFFCNLLHPLKLIFQFSVEFWPFHSEFFHLLLKFFFTTDTQELILLYVSKQSILHTNNCEL